MKRVYIIQADGDPEILGNLIGKAGLASSERLVVFSEALQTLPHQLRRPYLISLARTAAITDLGLQEASVDLDPDIQLLVEHQTNRATEYLISLFVFKGLIEKI